MQLDTTDTWIEDEDSIQVRRMWEQDLESRLDLPESEHEYEESLDVIKLPLPIPTEKPSSAPSFYSFVQMNMPYSSVLDKRIGVF